MDHEDGKFEFTGKRINEMSILSASAPTILQLSTNPHALNDGSMAIKPVIGWVLTSAHPILGGSASVSLGQR